MSATWVSPRTAQRMIGQKKLADLTNQAGQQELIGVGDGIEKVFTTPFVFADDLKLYVDGTEQVTGYSESLAADERIVVTFGTEPADGARLTASSVACANADNLDDAFLRGQALVRGMVDAALYQAPADDAANVPALVLGWAADIAWYLLIKSPRRPRLLEAYPEFEKGYIDTYDGIDSTLKRVAKGTFSLRGVLQYRGSTPPFSPPVDPTPQDVAFSSRPKIYADGRGVF